MTARSDVVTAFTGQLGDQIATAGTELVNSLKRRTVIWLKPAVDAAAGTATAEQSFYMAIYPCKVVAAYIVNSVAVTFDATNYASVLLIRRDAAGINNATVATWTSSAVSTVAHLPVTMGTLTSTVMVANSCLTASITKAGTGVALPPSIMVVVVEEGTDL